MKKKLFCCVIAFMLMVAGCAELPTASYGDGSPESSEAGASSAAATEAPESSEEKPVEQKEFDPNALRICIDQPSSIVGDQSDRFLTQLEIDLKSRIQAAGGPENIEFDSIPNEVSARKIAIERIRTEIMAGEGPDVFIVAGSNSLFPIPEKAMQEGVFLTLDEYIENAELGDWDNLTQPVLEAGRTEEGQQLVPMMYTLPVTIYSKESMPEMPPTGTTWQDMLADETGILRRAALMHRDAQGEFDMLPEDSVLPVLGEFADYETGELLFSKEELLNVTEELLALDEEIKAEGFMEFPEYLQGRFDGQNLATINAGSGEASSITKETPVTIIPIYSENGDVTATVQAYTGINRNTKHPEEAFFVVDYLMSAQAQQELRIFYMSGGFPVNEAVLSEEYPQQGGAVYLTDENFEAVSNLRDQISKVYFENDLVRTLSGSYGTCRVIQSGEITDQTVEGVVAETYDALKQMLSE